MTIAITSSTLDQLIELDSSPESKVEEVAKAQIKTQKALRDISYLRRGIQVYKEMDLFIRGIHIGAMFMFAMDQIQKNGLGGTRGIVIGCLLSFLAIYAIAFCVERCIKVK